jgi:hypothetical protein
VLRKHIGPNNEGKNEEEKEGRKIPIINCSAHDKNQLIILDPENPFMVMERKGRFYLHKIRRELNIRSITPLK